MKDTSVITSTPRTGLHLRSYWTGRKFPAFSYGCWAWALLLILLCFSPASGQTIASWTGATGSDWDSPNWTINGATGQTVQSGDTLVFSTTGTQTITNNTFTNFNAAGIYILAGTGTYTGNGFNLTSGITAASGQTATFANTGTITDSAASSTFSLLGNATKLLFSGPFSLTSGAAQTLSFYGFNNNSSPTFAGTVGLNTASNVTDTINAQNANVSFSSVISDGAGATNNGITFVGTREALLSLSGANTFTGGLTVVSGMVDGANVNTAFGTGTITIGASSNVAGSGFAGIGDTGGTSTFANAINVVGNSLNLIESDNSSHPVIFSGLVTLNGGNTLDVFADGPSQALTLNGGVTGVGNLVTNVGLSGTGTTAATSIVLGGSINNTGTLSNVGAATTSSGSTAGGYTLVSGVIGNKVTAVIQNSAASLILTGANQYTGPTIINGGTLNLGNSTATGSINSASSLVLGGGVLSYTTTGTNIQAFNGTTINAGASAVNSSAASGTDTVSLGAITRNVGGALNIGNTGIVTTTAGTTNGILGPWATYNVGANMSYATVSGGTVTGFTGTPAATAANVTDTTGTVNYDLSAVGALGTGASFNTLRYLNAGTAGTITGNFTANGLMNDGGALVYAGNVTIGATNELVITGPSNVTLSGGISDGSAPSALTMAGTGTLTLSGTSTYTGQTTIGSGAVALSGGTLGSGALVLGNNATATLILNNTNTTVASLAGGGVLGGNIVLGAGTLTTGSGNASTTYAGVISGTGGLIETGTGTLTLTGSNTYTGNTTINSGATLQVGDGATIAAAGVNSGYGAGAQNTTYGGTTVGSLASTSITDNGSLIYNEVSNQYLASQNREVLGEIVSGPITGTGSVTLLGGGTLTFTSGASVGSTFSGGLNIDAGTVVLYGSTTGTYGTTTSFAGTGAITIGNSAAAANLMAIVSAAGAYTYTNALDVAGTGSDTIALDYSSGGNAGSITFSGAVALSNNLTIVDNAAFVGATTAGITLSGNISGTGNLVLQSTNSGIGTGSTNITLSGASINNIGTITNNGAGTVTTGTINSIISGAIGTNVTGVIENSAASNLILTGANTFTSQISVQQGTLAIEGSGSLSGSNALVLGNSTGNTSGVFQLGATSTPSNVTVASLTTSGSGTGNAVVGGASSISTLTVSPTGADTFAGILGGAGANQNNLALTMAGSGSLTLSGANTYIGGTTFAGGTVSISAANNLGAAGNTLAFQGGALSLTANTVTLSGTSTIAGGDTATIQVASGAQLTLSSAISQTGSPGALTKTGLGTLVLSGANTFSGATLVSGGIVSYQNSTALAGNSAITVAAGAAVQIADGVTGGSQSITISGTGSAAGATGALEYLGTNQDQGGLGGALILGANATISSDTIGALFDLGGGSITGSGFTLTVTGAGNTEIDDAIGTGSGGLTWNGSGTLALTGANTYAGATTISSGTVQAEVASVANVSGALGNNSAVTLAAGAALDVQANTQVGSLTGGGNVVLSNGKTLTTGGDNTSPAAYTGAISGGNGVSGVTKIGSGTWTVAGANTYVGPTTVNGGTLSVTGSLASGSVVTVGGANASGTPTLTGTGTINGNVVVASAGTGAAGTITPGTSSNLTGTLNIGGTIDFQVGSLFADNLSGASAGELIIAGVATVTSGADISILGAPTSGDIYTLAVAASGSFSGTDGGFTLETALPSGWSIVATDGGADLVLEQIATNTGSAFFNGTTSDMGTAANFDTTASSNTAGGPIAAGTNVFFSANRNTNTSATLSSNLEVNSVNFGAGGTDSGITISSSNGSTLQIDATNANGNTAGSGITSTGGVSNTISANVALGGNQSWNVGAGSQLTVSGQVSDGSNGSASLTTAGPGVVVLSNPTGNIYSGGTTVSAGTLYVNNTSGSGTGSGAVTVNNGGTLAGSGNIATSLGVTINGGGKLFSGPVQTAAPTVTGPGLTFTNTNVAVSGTTLAPANLTFALGAGAGGSPDSFSSPNTNSTFLTLAGSSTINFTGTDSISLVDLTPAATLSLRQGVPYLLIAGAPGDITGLITESGSGSNAVYSIDGNGYVVGVLAAGSGYTGGTVAPTSAQYTTLAISLYGPDGVTPLNGSNGYEGAELYLNGGDLEVVPEPGTWALMLGGLALLMLIQNRRRANS